MTEETKQQNNRQLNQLIQGKNMRITFIAVIITALIVGGSVFVWQKYNIKSTEEKLQQQINKLQDQVGQYKPVPVYDYSNIIKTYGSLPIISRENDYEYPGYQYNFQINKNTEVFVRAKTSKEGGGGFPKGDVVLKTPDQQIVLLKDINVMGPGGESIMVFSTNIPYIYVIQNAAGDMGWFQKYLYYLDTEEKKLVHFSSEIIDSYTEITLVKNNSKINIKVKINDQCGEIGEREGKEAQIIDITLNGKLTGSLKKPISVICMDNELGPKSYNPSIHLEEIGVEKDFSKIYFSLKAVNWEWKNNVKYKVIWENHFYLDITDLSNPQIYSL